MCAFIRKKYQIFDKIKLLETSSKIMRKSFTCLRKKISKCENKAVKLWEKLVIYVKKYVISQENSHTCLRKKSK